MELEKKLKEIRKHMGGRVLFEVGMKPGGKIDILAAKNFGRKEKSKDETSMEDDMDYIG